MSQTDKAPESLRIEIAPNGFVVYATFPFYSRRDDGYATPVFAVARSSEELAGIVHAWAGQFESPQPVDKV